MGEAYGGTVRIGSQSVGGRLEELELRAEDILRSTGQPTRVEGPSARELPELHGEKGVGSP